MAGDVDQVPFVEIFASAQPGPPHAAPIEIVGEGSLDDFRPPPHRLLADPRTQAVAVGIDRHTGFVVAVPASKARLLGFGDARLPCPVVEGLQ